MAQLILFQEQLDCLAVSVMQVQVQVLKTLRRCSRQRFSDVLTPAIPLPATRTLQRTAPRLQLPRA